jgi:hypothetical protein
MTIGQAFAAGLGRVRRAPALVLTLWLATVLLALPLALTLRQALAEHLGSSLAADSAASAVNHDWWNEFLSQAAGVGQSFVPSILGFAAVLRNISIMADAQGLPIAIAGVVALHLLVSILLMGGVLDRLARDRRVTAYAFVAACGTYFFRLLRLALVAGVIYWVLFTSIHQWLFDSLFPALTHDLTVERTAVAYRALLYLAFASFVIAFNVLFDYARVRMVVEDRRSALGSLNAALRFIARHPRAVVGLYGLNLVVFLLLLAAYAVVAPGARGGLVAWLGVFVGQLYIALRVAIRLLFAASAISLFQSRLAHARYTAAPVAQWPDSPAAEAIISH